MATGDGWTSKLLTGLAEHLAAAGVGVWRPAGPAYVDPEIGIFDRLIPQTPDRVITLAPYVVASPAGLADYTAGVQARVRGTVDPRVCEDIADAIFDLLDSVGPLILGGIPVVQIFRQSYAALGTDGNGRWESSSNYYIQAMRPTGNRTD